MDVLGVIKKNEAEIKERFGVKRIGIFGSSTRGEAKKDSDIDVLVEFEEGKKTFDNFMELAFFLEEVFGRKIDLVTAEALRPELKASILKEVAYA
jgi:predicted nucleotidyltransferase